MSTHRHAWKQRAGVVVALAAGGLLTAPAAPALAATATVQPGSVTVNAGSDATVSVTILPSPEDKSGELGLTGLPSGVSCANGCGSFQFNGPPGSPKTVLLTLKANDNAGEANASVTVQVKPDQSDPATANFQVAVKPKPPPPTTQPPQVQTVKSVSGKVTIAANGDAVPNAVVMLVDSAQHQFQTTSDDNGNFRFTGSTDKPITPGRLSLGASKDAVVATKSISANAGQSLTGQRISLAIKVEVSPTATPQATEEATAPAGEATEEATDDQATEAAPAPGDAASNDEGGGVGSFLVILLGGLLVAAGVGTIVLLWMRRRNADDDDADGPAGAAAASAVPGARGAYRGADDHTRVVNRAGAGADPTMVGGAALSDAPTMMHRPIVDDVPPDPYAAPPQAYGAGAAAGGWAGNGYGDEPPAQGGYGQQAGYGNAPSSGGGYGAAGAAGGYGGAPASGGGYGAGQGGYPQQDQGGGYGEQRYDEPTGRYTGDAAQSYTAPADPYPTSTYQPEPANGYGQPEQGGYGRSPEPTGGYTGGNGYGAGQGGYDAGPQQGYDGGYDQRGGGYGGQPGGYDQSGGYGQQAGYDQPAGYGQEPPQPRSGGYDNHSYDQQQGGGYYGDQAPTGRTRPDATPQERGGRRLDWLDD
ncbi:carboxypeptidase-like regulatory domain-containing protein [Micromonospora sp. CPCC 205711]|uniref:carboxypeptidase-like regulatory domain-containing protein n=1 Tax=Micromonospora sp. CPCC 205547 TaxID=3122400 RepID=UPI002FF0C567